VSALERAIEPQAVAEIVETIAFAPPAPRQPSAPLDATVAAPHRVAAVAVAERPTPAATVAVQMSPEEKKKRSRKGFLWLAAALILLLLLGTAAALVAGRTTLELTTSTIQAGGSVTVVARHVPRNQVGDIQLHSVLHAYPFRANGNGDVR